MLSKIIYWLPRISSLLLVVFISLFALDVFQEPQWLLALLIHLIPSFILLVITLVAWKYELVGAIGFAVLAILYIVMVGFDRHWSWYVGISGPSLFVALLFFLSWRQKKLNK